MWKQEAELWTRGKCSRKDDDGIFNDPLSFLLHKLLYSRQIFADCFAFLRQKLFFKVVITDVKYAP